MSKTKMISRATARALCSAVGVDCGPDENDVMADEMRAVIAALSGEQTPNGAVMRMILKLNNV